MHSNSYKISKKHYGGLLLIVLGAFSFGIWYWFRTNTPGSQPSDFRTYNQLALNLVELGKLDYYGIPVVPPGYPAFLAFIYLLAGKSNFVAASIANIALFSLVAGLTGWASMRLYGPVAGYIAGMLVVLSHDMVFISQFGLSEILFLFFLLCMALALNKYSVKWEVKWLALAGVFGGLAYLTKGSFLIYIPGVVLWIVLINTGTMRSRFLQSAFFIIVILLFAVPWSYWISGKLNEVVIVTNYGIHTLYIGNSPVYYDALKQFLFGSGYSWSDFSAPTSTSSDAHMLREIWYFIHNSPLEWLHLYLLKLIYHLQFYNFRDLPSFRIALWSTCYWVMVWFLVILHFIKNRMIGRSIFTWIILVNLFIQPVIFLAQYFRYRIPIQPLFAIIASGGAALIIPYIFQTKTKFIQKREPQEKEM